MQIDRISDMIAHFIGLFDTVIEEARLRSNYAEGTAHANQDRLSDDDAARLLDKNYDLQLQDYDPGVKYRAGYYDFDYLQPHFARMVEHDMQQLANAIPVDMSAAHFRFPGSVSFEQERELVVHTGPGSVIAHVTQVNILQDDDYLNMTDGPNVARDTSFVTQRTVEFYNEAAVFTPFSVFQRTDSYDALQALAKSAHDYIDHARENDVTSLGTGAEQDFVLAGNDINGLYINGSMASEKPTLDDFMPDRGIAKPAEEPEKSDVSLHEDSPAGNSLDVAAGANVVANIATLVNTAVMASVTTVMGDYHQIDAITQAYVYSDRDEVDSVFTQSEDHDATAAYNIATFSRSVYPGAESADSSHDSGETPIFPTAWRVSVLEGDVSFVHWIEQYQFISDNDTLTVTSSGASVSLLSGGNAALNIANFLGIGMQYDLVIVGGNVLDMNLISQIAVLYDNDWICANPDAPEGATVQSGNNLLWNDASIHNVGSNDRFETMPDYMAQTVKAINERDPNMPDALAHDANFAGYQGINVLYITGNLYDVSIIKQVSVLGDSDYVTQAAAKILENNENVTIHIDTGSNAVINLAQIIDYDSFGSTTYVAGGLYSDAILIQGGIIENDASQPGHQGQQLANEVIAFLHDDPATIQNESDGVINAGHDMSWSSAHSSDVMQAVTA
ncbi:hypothetical protein EXN24_12880 [Rhizobium rhizogenes]|uniref:Type I secretion protein n=2 Tax=Rhizobium/Agrobacterium group TaxID=227290 RepID=A0AB36EHN9_AGRTU|nr:MULTISPECIES: hypothetical protein [Rhizobium/Agrobacterium group]MDP9758656.1 hypothetical protein [Agrobacterium tumefaciens]MDQ1219899.1 hypothetical protein [Agrobacterium sp. SORGH_AS_0745]OCJ37572.1 hypothetical protein A6U91_04940 [Agrobacterium tumefaciens]OMP70621.1 hypothetical protein BV900_21115 [Agrobacterium tumefaciens]TRA88888.1 hypothetical protein EXN24_12880 [Rhizobium rhizogenes]